MTRATLLIGLLVAFVLTVLFWFFLYQPQNEREREVAQEIADLRTQQQTLEGRRQALEEVQRNEVQIRAALARTEEFIPSGVSQPAALRQLQRTADAAGIEIAQLTFGNPTPAEAGAGLDTGNPERVLAAIPVTIAVDGGYFQIVDFLRRLEVDVPRATLVENVSLLESPEADFPTLRATLASSMFAVMDADRVAGEGGTAGAPTGAPAPSPTPTPSPGASPSPSPEPAS